MVFEVPPKRFKQPDHFYAIEKLIPVNKPYLIVPKCQHFVTIYFIFRKDPRKAWQKNKFVNVVGGSCIHISVRAYMNV